MISERDRKVLEVGGTYFKYAGRKMTVALEETGYTESAFWQRFGWLTDQAEVAAEFPALCRRARRLREARRAARTRYSGADG